MRKGFIFLYLIVIIFGVFPEEYTLFYYLALHPGAPFSFILTSGPSYVLSLLQYMVDLAREYLVCYHFSFHSYHPYSILATYKLYKSFQSGSPSSLFTKKFFRRLYASPDSYHVLKDIFSRIRNRKR